MAQDGTVLGFDRSQVRRSRDGGQTCGKTIEIGAGRVNVWRSDALPDWPRGTSYGCIGGLIRLPISDRDILLYSDLDSDGVSYQHDPMEY